MSRKPGYKDGINNTDRVRLLALAADGCSADEISDILRVQVEVVENWLPKKEDKPKRGRPRKDDAVEE